MKKFFVGILSVVFLGVFLLGATACKSSEKVATKIALQYGVGKYLEKQSPASRITKARDILNAVMMVEQLAGSDATTVDALRAYVAQRLYELPPSDRLALGAVVDLASELLKEKVGDGVLKGDQVVKVREVLSWVSEAANAYVPATPE